MKKIILFLGSLLLLTNCYLFDSNNHAFIYIENQSETDFKIGHVLFNIDEKCIMTFGEGDIIYKNETYAHRPFNDYIEREVGLDDNPYEFYLVSTKKFNNNSVFYDCDSISIKNDILKHYVLTLEDLEALDFKIVYTGE